jgi:hypothetical protein
MTWRTSPIGSVTLNGGGPNPAASIGPFGNGRNTPSARMEPQGRAVSRPASSRRLLKRRSCGFNGLGLEGHAPGAAIWLHPQ